MSPPAQGFLWLSPEHHNPAATAELLRTETHQQDNPALGARAVCGRCRLVYEELTLRGEDQTTCPRLLFHFLAKEYPERSMHSYGASGML